MVLAIDSTRLATAQIYLQAMTAREDSVSYRFDRILYGTDSLTSYDSEK
jgi:hypothetical protein